MHLHLDSDTLATLPSVLAAGPLAGSWIWTIVIGFVVGVVAKFLTPGRDPAGCLITTIIGIVGSLVAYYLGRALNWYAEGDAPGFIASVIGAVILLVIYHLIVRRTGGPSV